MRKELLEGFDGEWEDESEGDEDKKRTEKTDENKQAN